MNVFHFIFGKVFSEQFLRLLRPSDIKSVSICNSLAPTLSPNYIASNLYYENVNSVHFLSVSCTIHPNTSAKLIEMDTASTTHSTPKKVQILLKSWSLKINFCCQIICTCESSSGKNVKMYIEHTLWSHLG